MIRKKIENVVGPLTDNEFIAITSMATGDIKINRIAYKKRTTRQELLAKLITCYKIDRRLRSIA